MKSHFKYSVLGVLCLCTTVGSLSAVQAKTAKPVSTPTHASVSASSNTGKATLSYPVNINTADAATLASLPGIGQSRAQAIVSYRQDHGNFKSIEDLAGVKGISKGYVEKNKQYLTVQ